MDNIKRYIPSIIGYMLVNYLVNGEFRGWAGVIGAGIFGGLSDFLFERG